jgi:hypothetical protein
MKVTPPVYLFYHIIRLFASRFFFLTFVNQIKIRSEMKKIISLFSIVAMIITINSYAQKVSKPSTNESPAFTSKDSALCRPWKLVTIEEFGVANPPGELQKNDGITFMKDGTVFFTQNGKAKTGTWTLDKGRTWININFEDTKEQMKFKLMKVDDRQLSYEYQDPHLIRTIFNYDPVKK